MLDVTRENGFCYLVDAQAEYKLVGVVRTTGQVFREVVESGASHMTLRLWQSRIFGVAVLKTCDIILLGFMPNPAFHELFCQDPTHELRGFVFSAHG